MRIVIFLPRDRAKQGLLHLFGDDGRFLTGNIRCLGKADNQRAIEAKNPLRDSTRPYGDTPSGTYAPSKVTLFEPVHPRLGKAAILIDGVEGNALIAKEEGRTGLAIHGGRGNDGLVPTYGCVRVLDRDMEKLVMALGDLPVTVEIEDLG